MLASKSKQSSSSTSKPVKSLSTSISREEAKTPEIETVQQSRKKQSTPTRKKASTKPNGPKSSPLSSRAQRIKQSLRNKIEVSAVILKEDGTSSEVKYNGSSKQSNVILGGRPSIIGEYEELGVIIVRSLNQSSGSLNKTILPVPYCNKQYNGPYLLYKVDKLGNPTDLRVEEYSKFVAKNKGLTESARKNFNPIDDQQISTKSNLSSNTKLTLVYLRSEVDRKIRAEYEKKNGKKPSSADIEKEVNEAVQKLVDELVSSSSPMNDPDYNPSEEDESKGDDKASIIASLKRVYKQENLGKEVDNKELLTSLENTATLLATENYPDFEDERDWRLQLNDALNYVRERGRLDGRILAEKISETFYELNGAEPSLDELVDVFRRIKSELADEAEKDLIADGYIKDTKGKDNGSAYYLAKKFGDDLSRAQPADIVDYAFRIVKEDWISRAKSVFKSTKGRLPNESELAECVESLALKLANQALDIGDTAGQSFEEDYDSEEDVDYDPNNAIDKKQLKQDKEEDQFDSDYFNLKMLTTESSKSSKTGKSQTYDVYFCKFSKKREARNLEQAIQTFKLRNKREPNAVEISKIKQFISTKPTNNLIQFKLSVVSDSDNDGDEEEKSDVLYKRSRGGVKTGPTTPSKVLVTPVKEKKTSSRYSVYFGDSELDQKKSETQALKWFKRFNHRKPNELELAGIKQFVAADKTQLTTVEYQVPADLKGLIIGDDDKKETEEDDSRLGKLRFNEKDIIKKRNKSTKYTLNFDNEEEREAGNTSQAIKWFKRFNNRAPNSEERGQINKFVKADADENTVDID